MVNGPRRSLVRCRRIITSDTEMETDDDEQVSCHQEVKKSDLSVNSQAKKGKDLGAERACGSPSSRTDGL